MMEAKMISEAINREKAEGKGKNATKYFYRFYNPSQLMMNVSGARQKPPPQKRRKRSHPM